LCFSAFPQTHEQTCLAFKPLNTNCESEIEVCNISLFAELSAATAGKDRKNAKAKSNNEFDLFMIFILFLI